MTDSSKYEDILYRERPASGRPPMDISHRAKQFAPFAALKGFEEAVHAREIQYEGRKELSEERKAELDRRLQALEVGMRVSVTYFEVCQGQPEKGCYRSLEGMIENLKHGASLRVCGVEIPVREIVELERA